MLISISSIALVFGLLLCNFKVSAMELSESAEPSTKNVSIQQLEEDSIKTILSKNSSRDLFNFLSTCKRYYSLGNDFNFMGSFIKLANLKNLFLSKPGSFELKIKQTKQALTFQNTICYLSDAFQIDINQKKRGEIHITTKLTADEIHETLEKLPSEYISSLSPNVQWFHWIAQAPLFALTEQPYNKEMIQKLGVLLTSEKNFSSIEPLRTLWEDKLEKLSTKHPHAAFLWALHFKVFPIHSNIKYVVTLPSQKSSNENLIIKAFDGTLHSLDSEDKSKIQVCYKKAIDAKIPTAQEELKSWLN